MVERPGALAHDVEDARALEVLLELTQKLVSSLDIQEILYTVVERIARVVDVERVSIVLAPDERQVGHVVAASDDAKLFNLQIDLEKYPEIVHVLATREPLTIDDVQKHPLLEGVRGSVTDLSALTLVPIVYADRAMGVLFVRARTPRGALGERQIAFCRVLCNATAIALRNARTLTRLRDATARDANARVEAEGRVRMLERYQELLSSVHDGIAAFDASGTVLFANPHANTIFGHEPEYFTGRSLWELVPPEGRKGMLRLRHDLQEGRFPQDVDLTVRRKDGTHMEINGSFAPLGGNPGVMLLSFRDVTTDRRTRAELVSTRNFLQSLIDASVDAIVAADLSGTIVLFNRGAERLYGYEAKDVLHKMSVEKLYPGDGAREVMRMLRSRKHGGVNRLGPIRIDAVDAKGAVFPISLTAAVILESGKPKASFGIFTDLRERVRVETELQRVQEKLAVSEKQAILIELAGATAHELNQPLTSVMGYAELLTRKIPENAPTFHAADVIHREAQRMADIVRKIGRLTKYQTKSYVGQQRIVDLDSDAGGESDPEREPVS